MVFDGLKLHANAVGTVLFTLTTTVLVQHFKGAEETGYYQLAVQLTTVALTLPQAASMVLYGDVAQHGADAAWRSNRRVVAAIFALMFAGVAASVVLAPWLIPIAAGQDFQPAVSVFQILAVGILGQSLSLLMAPQWIGRGLYWQVSVVSLTIGVLTFAAAAAVIPAHGMRGAAYAALAASLASGAANLAMAFWVERRAKVASSRQDAL
jgi:O-antigen/teichoic acid export membrane protein